MEAPAPSNVINLADKICVSIERQLPVMKATGVAMSIAPMEQLDEQLHSIRRTVEMVIDGLLLKRPTLCHLYKAAPQVFLARQAAILYRCAGELKAAEKQSAKLDRKLRKAKKRARR